MLAAMALLVAGLEEAASHLNWSGGTVLGPLIASAVLWVAFLGNSRRASGRQERGDSAVELVFPWRFVRRGLWSVCCCESPLFQFLLLFFSQSMSGLYWTSRSADTELERPS
jgi:hypothetical protein